MPRFPGAPSARQTAAIESFRQKVDFIHSIAELLRGEWKESEYGKVMLPFVVLRRLDCALELTKEKVLTEHAKLKIKNVEPVLTRVAGHRFYNTSKLDFRKLLDDPTHIARNLRAYIDAFSTDAKDILTNFEFDDEITKLDKADVLYQIVAKFASIDLHPDVVSSIEMGYIFEELIRRFAEQSNEAAGEHFTPREVIRLMVNILFASDTEILKERGALRTMYDPACGTGGMLSVADDHLRELNPHARLEMYGQELNPESYAICKSDMVLKGQDPGRIHPGNSFKEDGESGSRFDYMLSNPPYGVEWKKVQDVIRKEHAQLGFNGRFGAGLPRITDGSLLFLQHMLAKMKDPARGGSRIAIVFNASPLFTGGPESGESNIRRWVIENDWLEAVIALPEELFYNTGIATYVWVLTNRKAPRRKGKVQLIDARAFYQKMKKSLGNKRNELAREHIAAITRIHAAFMEGEQSKVIANDALGYRRVRVERPLRVRYEITAEAVAAVASAPQAQGDGASSALTRGRKPKKTQAKFDREHVASQLERLVGTKTTDHAEVERILEREVFSANGRVPATMRRLVLEAISVRDPAAPIARDAKGAPKGDPILRTYENVPLNEDTGAYFEREVRSYAPEAWISSAEPKIGYEIPLTRLFYRYHEPRPLAEIDTEIRSLEETILSLLRDAT